MKTTSPSASRIHGFSSRKKFHCVAAGLGFLLAACGPTAPPDHYDPSKMDLKPVSSKTSAERHAGPLSSGSSLSTVPEIKSLDPAAVKTIRLDTTHKVIEIAP
ncbi:MAG: hypothetical protein ABI728_07110, partial [Betaproteobacteria bacterium]